MLLFVGMRLAGEKQYRSAASAGGGRVHHAVMNCAATKAKSEA
jgi:hypothetical protein